MTNPGARENRIRRWLHKCIWAAMLIISVSILLPKPDQNALVDFGAGWSAARLLCRGENPYDRQGLLETEKAAGWNMPEPVVPWNPPWALSIMIPFALFPFKYAKWSWFLLNSGLIFVLSDHWWRVYGGAREHRMASWLVSLWFFPCIVAVYFGQMSLLVLAGITGMAWSVRRDKVGWLGFFTLLASLKPHLLLPMWLFFILWVVRQRRWRTLLWAGSGIVFACTVVAFLRHDIFQAYLAAANSADGPVIWATPTIGTALRVAFKGIPKWIVFLPSLCGLLLSLGLWRSWAGTFSWERYLDWILLVSMLTASYAWIFDWAILLPSVIRVLVWFQSTPALQWPPLAGLLIMMCAFVWAQNRGLFPLGVVWFPGGLTFVYGWASRRQDRHRVPGILSRNLEAS